jgi:predicted HD phosphohydrolase
MFRTLEEATPHDWQIIIEAEAADRFKRSTGDRLLGLLGSLRDADALGSPINLYAHSLQTATRALRAGEDDELVVIALFHDLPEALSDNHHGLLAAELLSPWISERREWLLVRHVDFQQFHFVNHPAPDRHARDRFAGHPCYAETEHFCKAYDQNSFDRDYTTLPLEEFAPMVTRFFARPRPPLRPPPCAP